jgi:hypothetical protein
MTSLSSDSEPSVRFQQIVSALMRMLDEVRVHYRHAPSSGPTDAIELEFRVMTDKAGVDNTNLAMIRALITSITALAQSQPTRCTVLPKEMYINAYFANSIRRRIHAKRNEVVMKKQVASEHARMHLACANRPLDLFVSLSTESPVSELEAKEAFTVPPKQIVYHYRNSFEIRVTTELTVRYDITKVSVTGTTKQEVTGDARYHVEMELVSPLPWIEDAQERQAANRVVAVHLLNHACSLLGVFDATGSRLPPPDLRLELGSKKNTPVH